MKEIKRILIALIFALFAAGTLRAAESAALTITIRPNAYYAVSIDTTQVVMDLGTVNLGGSTQTVRPATVTIQSTYASTDLKLQGSVTSSTTPWTFDDNTASSDTNKIAAWATFTSVARSSAPAQTGDYFSGTMPGASGSDVLDSGNRYVGSSATDLTTDLFENNSGFDSRDMDGLLPDPYASGKSHLWLYFRMPSAASANDAQNITITITATQPN